MKLGLKRGLVELFPHDVQWEEKAAETVARLKEILQDTAVDIQHVGSTSIRGIYAKPILDFAIGVRSFEEILEKKALLEQNGVIYRGQDHPGQHLFVIGDFEADTRTHHIHVVLWDGAEWNNYVNFRDYLNAFPEKAAAYDILKRQLVAEFAEDRGRYTSGKHELIQTLLKEAHIWKNT